MSGISVFSLKHNFKLSAYNTTYDIAAFAQSSKLKQINEKKYWTENMHVDIRKYPYVCFG